jgi:hypothetical protein
MKIAEYVSECPLCEEDIQEGENILFCHQKKEWHHFQCPWQDDVGYRPDMVRIDIATGAKNIMEHEKNKWRDRPTQQYFKPICQESGTPTIEKKNPSLKEKIINFIWKWLGY